jgi:hypothetical protein
LTANRLPAKVAISTYSESVLNDPRETPPVTDAHDD